ncbi:IS602 transposase [Escherichia coli]|nr:IS602 transposase [Escherichia coli]
MKRFTCLSSSSRDKFGDKPCHIALINDNFVFVQSDIFFPVTIAFYISQSLRPVILNLTFGVNQNVPDLLHFKHIFPQFPQGALLIHIKTGFAPKKQVVKYQRDVREVALALELNPDHLRKWIRLYKQELQGIGPAGNAITPEQREIQQLKAQIKRLETEKEILKQAAVLMSEIPGKLPL